MKFAVLFCLVALACVAQAEETSVKKRISFTESARQKLAEAKQKVDELIHKASGALKEKLDQARQKVDVLVEKLKTTAFDVSDKVYNSINKVLDTVSDLENRLKKGANAAKEKLTNYEYKVHKRAMIATYAY